MLDESLEPSKEPVPLELTPPELEKMKDFMDKCISCIITFQPSEDKQEPLSGNLETHLNNSLTDAFILQKKNVT
jgi:hypothetical protein